MQAATSETPLEHSQTLAREGRGFSWARCSRNSRQKSLAAFAPPLFAWCIYLGSISCAAADDPKGKDGGPQATPPASVTSRLKKSAWSYPSYKEARQSVAAALGELKIPAPQLEAALRNWPDSQVGPTPDTWLDRLAESLQIALPSLQETLDRARNRRVKLEIPDFGPIAEAPGSPFVKDHLRLLAGRWLAQHEYYDEALEFFAGLEPNSLIDPATLLFHTAAAHHQLLHQQDCLTAVSKLLENESSLPGRYRSLAQLMEADFRPLEADSLDETSRLMESVERRLGLGHAGKRVRFEEDAVVSKLDKLIEDLEKKREEQQKQQQSGASGTQPPSKPMQDSQAAGGKGPGNVDPKKVQSLGAWGNIPPKQRQEALQQLGRDLPAHYREVVEEYFRKLASEEKPPKD